MNEQGSDAFTATIVYLLPTGMLSKIPAMYHKNGKAM